MKTISGERTPETVGMSYVIDLSHRTSHETNGHSCLECSEGWREAGEVIHPRTCGCFECIEEQRERITDWYTAEDKARHDNFCICTGCGMKFNAEYYLTRCPHCGYPRRDAGNALPS